MIPLILLDIFLLVRIPCSQRQVEDKGNPVAIDQEEEGEQSLYGGFRDDVGVETVAKVDWVDVVTMQGALVSSLGENASAALLGATHAI